MLNRRLQTALVAAATAVSLGAALAPTGASAAASGRHHHGHHHHSQSVNVRSFDTKMLGRNNSARTADSTPTYTMNHKLWTVAHKWAKHLAKTGVLEHNPNLTPDIQKKCPSWTAIGENVGVVYGETGSQLFQAYMASPEHRANILDKHYKQVGIASVKVVRNGQTEEWNVMDFGNHCK